MALSSLSLRLISSVVLIPVVAGVIWFGGWLFAAVATLVMCLALYEWMRISPSLLIKIIGVFYIGFSLFEILLLRNEIFFRHFDYYMPYSDGDGVWYILTFLMAIWASDSTAYLFGKTIGGPKMSPTVSPNKTWAGYAGALVGPVAVLVLEQLTHPHWEFDNMDVSYLRAAIFGAMIGIVGQSGDLMISFMKRKAGLKDTGALIPGHGGILDRIDATLLALPVYMGYLKMSLTLDNLG